MVYEKPLPKLKDLCRLARAIDNWPATSRQINQAARKQGFGQDIIDFLDMFAKSAVKDVFENRGDFYTRAAEVAMLICEERETPKEKLLNPQG